MIWFYFLECLASVVFRLVSGIFPTIANGVSGCFCDSWRSDAFCNSSNRNGTKNIMRYLRHAEKAAEDHLLGTSNALGTDHSKVDR